VRFVFDTSVLIDYLRDPTDSSIAADALALATERGETFVSLISLMELYLPQDKGNQEITREVKAIRELCEWLSIRIIPASGTSQ
jgi:predicted nucleic acid-binding protein